MGDYGVYIWPAFILLLLVFALNIWLPIHQFKRLKKKLRDQYASEA